MKIWIQKSLCFLLAAASFCLTYIQKTTGQQATIGYQLADDLSFSAAGPAELNFNNNNNLISNGTTVAFGPADPQAAVFLLRGAPGREVCLTIEAPDEFSLDGIHTVPFELRIAYNDYGSETSLSARNGAIVLPAGQNTVYLRLPGSSGTSGISGEENLEADHSKIYLFIFGTLGPVPHDAPPGMYTASILVHANYYNGNN